MSKRKTLEGRLANRGLISRPRHIRAELDRQSAKVDERISEDRAHEAACVVKFEARIADLIASGAGDRATAIRWDKDALGGDYIDDGYYEYLNGLPMGYFAKGAE